MKFNQWFPDCIGDELLTNVDNKKLKKYCLTLKKSKQGKFASYSNTWQSHNLDIRSPILKELIIEFYVWKSISDLRSFSDNKEIQVVDETDPDTVSCPVGFHKDFSGKCVPDDPVGDVTKDKLIDTLKGFLFGTVALSLLARKY